MINGVSLKSVKLKKTVFNGHIADKMECFHGSHCTDPIQFLWQVTWLWSVANFRGEKLKKLTCTQGMHLSQYDREIVEGERDWGC